MKLFFGIYKNLVPKTYKTWLRGRTDLPPRLPRHRQIGAATGTLLAVTIRKTSRAATVTGCVLHTGLCHVLRGLQQF